MANGVLCWHTRGKNIYKIKYLTFKRPHKHFNINRKAHVKPKNKLENLIKKIKKTFFLKSSISLIFLCILALS